MKRRNIIRTFVLRGFIVGLFFPILGLILCYCILDSNELYPSLSETHKSFPLLWIIDCAPLVLGSIAFIVGNQVQKSDLELRLELEHANQDLGIKNEELIKLISEKEVLLKEVHHRVKNNLQVVNGLLSLQASFLDDKKSQSVFQYSQQRITSMSMIHEMLYHSKDLSKIDFNEYAAKLINELVKAFELPNTIIGVHIEVSRWFNIDTAIPLGILINEIVTNSLKHGFVGRKKGKISLQIIEAGNGLYTMTIGDDGIGFEGTLGNDESSTLGLLLIDQLVLQLNGSIVKDETEIGTKYALTFQELTPKS